MTPPTATITPATPPVTPSTSTSDLVAATAEELQLMAAFSQGDIGCLPAQVLYIAAQFASRDEAKQVLQLIHVRKGEDGLITIESTDGHRAFRFRFQECNPVRRQGEHWYINRDLLLDASIFRKRVSYGHWAMIKDNGTAEILGGKIAKGSECPPSKLIEARPYKHVADGFIYPKLDQLWPDKFENVPGGPISLNASYLSKFLAEVTSYSHNGVVKMSCNKPSEPLVFSSSCELSVPGLENCQLEYLLMPVQVRT